MRRETLAPCTFLRTAILNIRQSPRRASQRRPQSRSHHCPRRTLRRVRRRSHSACAGRPWRREMSCKSCDVTASLFPMIPGRRLRSTASSGLRSHSGARRWPKLVSEHGKDANAIGSGRSMPKCAGRYGCVLQGTLRQVILNPGRPIVRCASPDADVSSRIGPVGRVFIGRDVLRHGPAENSVQLRTSFTRKIFLVVQRYSLASSGARSNAL